MDRLLGNVEHTGEKGPIDHVIKKSMIEVIDIIVEREGIAIPAHADKGRGLFKTTQDAIF